MKQSSTLKIDIDEVLRNRLPRHYRYIPKFLIKWVERTICQERLNELLKSNDYEKNKKKHNLLIRQPSSRLKY